MLLIYRLTCIVLLVLIALMSLIYRRHNHFAKSTTTVLTPVLIVIAFQVQRLRMLAHAAAKLEELLRLLERTRDHLPQANRNECIANFRKFERRCFATSRFAVPSASVSFASGLK